MQGKILVSAAAFSLPGLLSGTVILTVINALLLALNLCICIYSKQKRIEKPDDVGVFVEKPPKADYLSRIDDGDANIIQESQIDFTNSVRKTQSEEEMVNRMEALILKHISDPQYSINDLCSDLAKERSGVYKILHRCTGMAPSTFIGIKKVAYVRELLTVKPSISDEDLAFSVGFTTTKQLKNLLIRYAGTDIQQLRLSLKGTKVSETDINRKI